MSKATKTPRVRMAPAATDDAVRELKDLHGGASIYDVAEQADVSIVTVSRVFNDYPHVSERMRERVFTAARRVGYTPRLVSKRNVLAAIVGHLDHLSAGDYKTRLLLHIVRVAAKNGYLVEFIPYDSVELATKHLVNGMVEVGLTGDEVARLTNLPKVPKVAINKQPADPDWNSVSSDHRRETQLAVEHLGSKGHRRIALVLDEPQGWGVERRRLGYEEALAKLGDHSFSPLVFCSSDTSSEQIARRIRDARCTACVNLTDNYGFAVIDAFTNGLGMRVPDDISMVSLENESVSPFLHPRLTTIAQPLETIAETAVSGIIEQLRGRKKRFSQIVESRLIDRDSVRAIS
ncbi:MAG TPA: LacI family DNA-binding transcriptional regulator [Kiritimatiellia bacterium]|jgi:DNA-binding LacI/PurR family transcriptional regulator